MLLAVSGCRNRCTVCEGRSGGTILLDARVRPACEGRSGSTMRRTACEG